MEIFATASLPMIGAVGASPVFTVRGADRPRVVPLKAPAGGALPGTAMPGSRPRNL